MATWYETGPEVLICQYKPGKPTRNPSSMPRKVAAFDLDSTLIKSKSGKWKTEDPDDWKWWHPTVPDKLQQAIDDNFHVVIITNQGRLTLQNGSASPVQELFKDKIETILRALNLPVTLYAACANDNWRKPRTSAWEHYVQSLREAREEVDEAQSFLVGDAAGRVGDHDDADRCFCENIGIRFFTPEEWFLGGRKEEYINRFDPKQYLRPNRILKVGLSDLVLYGCPALYLLIGLPGAGKTTFFSRKMESVGCERVNPHSFKSVEDITDRIKALTTSSKSVILDDLNIDRVSRRGWISLAQDLSLPVCAIFFSSPPELCLHNDAVRALGEPKRYRNTRKVYPRSEFWQLVEKLEEPTLKEGFEEVHRVDFEWVGTEETRKIWQKFWV